ncbi:sensor histidine kinase [Paenibacillus ferrarius]|uniref:sensor histidine kinase n=1 Tax=Paenibacillus ferrarius TaxID=1469647 RepID=UPI003D2E11EE
MRIKIRAKIIGSTMLVVMVSLLFSSYITYTYMSRILQEQAVKDNMTKLAQTSSSLTRMQDRLVKTAETIIADPEINAKIVSKPGATLEMSYFNKVAVLKQLQRFVALDSSLLNIMIVNPDKVVFSNYSGYESYYEEYLKEDWLQPFLSGTNDTRFSAIHPLVNFNGVRDVISYVTPYRNWEDKSSGSSYFLIIEMKKDEIDKVFSESSKDFQRIILRGGDGRIIFDTNREETSESANVSSDDVISIRYDAMREGWNQEAYISKQKLYESFRPILLFYLLIVIGGLMFILLIVPTLIFNFTKPITQLARAMRKVSVGELNTNVLIRSGDEMEVLGEGFNRMVNELDAWMKTSMREQEIKRNMQTNLLLSEINPHFIYNTLNTVIYLSHAGRNKDTITITKALIAILQDTIKTGEDAFFSTLDEEMNLVAQYIHIQQYRYPDRFRVEWAIPDRLRSCVVLRLMIQPLVENALVHGIFNLEEEGVIRISALAQENTLCVTVTDNGIGLDADSSRYQVSQRHSGCSGQTKGIGLANIRERIAFHYGDKYGLDLASQPNSGTSVTLRIPLRTGEQPD